MKWEAAAFETSVGKLQQLQPSTLPEIALCGRSNVGKSSLINRLLSRKSLARTSATPGKTATINFYRVDALRLVDLPGYGYAKVSAQEKQRWGQLIEGYFDADRDSPGFAAGGYAAPAHGGRFSDDDLSGGKRIPFLIVLTKADKLKKTERLEREKRLAEELRDFENIVAIPFSAVNGEGVERLARHPGGYRAGGIKQQGVIVDVCGRLPAGE